MPLNGSTSDSDSPLFYPIGLNLTGKRIFIAGAGNVAARKLARLVSHECVIQVVSPACSAAFLAILREHDELERVKVHTVSYDKSQLEAFQPHLVFACTNDPAVNSQIVKDANAREIWVNVATDGARQSDFILPSLLEYDALMVAIFSSGASPLFSRKLRESIEQQVGPWARPYLQVVQTLRQEIQAQVSDEAERRSCYEALLNDPELLSACQTERPDIPTILSATRNRLPLSRV